MAVKFREISKRRAGTLYLQINMVHAQLLQAGFKRGGDISNVGQDFGDNVELLASDAGLLDSGTQLTLGLVHFGAIEVVVAETDGHFGAVNALLVQLALIAGLVPGCACAVAQLFERLEQAKVSEIFKVSEHTMGILVPSLSLRFGMGV